LNSLGINTRQEKFAGYVEMMLDPHDTVIPADLLDKVLAWLRATPVPQVNPMPGAALTPMLRPVAQARLPLIRETATYLDNSHGLFAIVCEPDIAPCKDAEGRRQVLLLLNAGAVHHVGPNRLYVTLARTLAIKGMTVIRLDIAGLGDSLTKPGQVENATYPPLACKDVAQAVNYVRTTLGAASLHLAGICSGGYHSLKAAADGMALTSITVINPQTFFWKEGMSLAQREHLVTAESIRYQSRALEISAWLKLLRGDVDVRTGAHVVRRRLALRVVHAMRELARWLHIPLSDDLTVEIDDICRRGTHIQFVFSASDPGLSMLLEQGGRLVRRLQRTGAICIDVIDGADHTFTTLWARNTLTRLLSSHLALP
jgi:predicted alpha/beta hydrolase